MKVLVLGSGGREHSIVWKLAQSSKIKNIFAIPGNPGIGKFAKNIPLKIDDIPAILSFAISEKIDLTVVGPEYPLTLGIVDEFRKAGLRIFGPTKDAALLEGSKYFAKEVMTSAKVKTAQFETFVSEATALRYLETHGAPLVVKADGLAAGKGVCVCQTKEEAKKALSFVFNDLKSSRIIIEECLTGREVSYIVATDGENIVPFASSHDYKRIFDNDKGPNTGGMGTVSPTPRLSKENEARVIKEVIHPVINEMKRRGTPFTGFLYAGLMISDAGDCSVIEFNARMGDPECQVIMRRMKSDLFELLYALSLPDGGGTPTCEWDSNSALCVVLAAEGYPGDVKKGDEIFGIEQAEQFSEVVVFHAGTLVTPDQKIPQKILTNGGRVLNVTALGTTLSQARANAYKACDMIQFRGQQLRRDIGSGG